MTRLIDFYKKYSYQIWFIVSLLVGLLPAFWFKGYMIAGEEYYSLDYEKWGRMFADSWFDRVNFGEFSPLIPFKFQQLFFKSLYLLGFNKYTALVSWTVFLTVTQSVSFYMLLYQVFKKSKSPFIYFICTLFYIYNPYFLNISFFLTPAKIIFAVLPMLFILFYKIYLSFKKAYLYVFLINLLLFLSSPLFVNIPSGLVLVVVVFIYFFFLLFLHKISLSKAIKLLSWMSIIYIAFNVWWIVPTGYKQFSSTGSLENEARSFNTIDQTKIGDILSLFGSWALREHVIDTKYYYFPFFTRFDSFPGVIFRFVPFIFVALGVFSWIIMKRINDINTNFIFSIYIIYLVFIFLSKGTSEPFGSFYSFLYQKLPLFWMFREPYAKFLPFAVFAESFLLVIGVDYLYKLSDKIALNKIRIASLISYYFVVIFSFGFLAYPFFIGEIVWNVNDGKIRSHVIDIPKGWHEIINNWQPKSGYYYLLLSQTFYDRYIWNSGYSGNPYLILTDAKTINPHKGYSESDNIERRKIFYYLFRTILTNPTKLREECARYNLSGFIFQKDVNPSEFLFYEVSLRDIPKSYKDFNVFENSNAAIYDCPSQLKGKVRLSNPAALLSILPSDFNYYHILKYPLDSYPLFKIDSNLKSDFHLLEPTLNASNKIEYDISNLSSAEKIYVYKNQKNISSVYIDDHKIYTTNEGDYTIIDIPDNENCCKKLILDLLQINPKSYTQTNPWFKMPISNLVLRDQTEINGNEMKLDEKYSYLTLLNDFDVSSDYRIAFTLDQPVSGLTFGASLIQRNIENNNLRYISNFRFESDKIKPALLGYNGATIDFINLIDKSEFYLSIYGNANVKGLTPEYKKILDNLTLNPSALTVTKLEYPFIYSIRSPEVKTTSAELNDYKEISTYMILFNINSPEKNQILIHFLNSYHKDWRLLQVNKKEFVKLQTGRFSISAILNYYLKSKHAKEPINIEFYSNGWSPDIEKGDNYFVLVFWPALLSKLLWMVSSSSVVIVSIYTLYRNRISK